MQDKVEKLLVRTVHGVGLEREGGVENPEKNDIIVTSTLLVRPAVTALASPSK